MTDCESSLCVCFDLRMTGKLAVLKPEQSFFSDFPHTPPLSVEAIMAPVVE